MGKVEEISEIKLLDVIEYYERNIQPYKYIYRFKNNLTIGFKIEEEEVCHLLTGTLPKNMPNKRKYKGIEGYNNIKSGEFTFSNLPQQIKKSKLKSRCKAFLKLDKVLKNPKAIFYNPKIIKKGKSIKLENSVLDAEYLFYKIIDEKIVHVFLRNDNKSDRIIVVSLFKQREKDNEYITDQVEIKLIDQVEKVKIK